MLESTTPKLPQVMSDDGLQYEEKDDYFLCVKMHVSSSSSCPVRFHVTCPRLPRKKMKDQWQVL